MRKNSYHAGRWTVERERMGDANRVPPPARPEQEALGDFLPKVLRKMGLKDQGWLAEIASNWAEIAGEEIAANCRPGRYDGGVLSIYVSHPGWIQELKQRGERLILGRLQERFGPKRIRSLRFQIDPGDDA